MGAGCCGPTYEDRNGVLAIRKGLHTKREVEGMISPHYSIDVNYEALPNRFGVKRSGSELVGLAGLENLGNTCFINSALQCLLNAQPLTDYFLAGIHKSDINLRNSHGTQGSICRAYFDVLKAQWTDEYERIRPVYLVELIWNYSKDLLVPGAQNDAQEFLAFFLDKLHEDLNRIRVRKKGKFKQPAKSASQEVKAAVQWKNYLLNNNSVIVDLFNGQLRSTLKCLECNYTSITFDTFMYLSLPIPNKQEVTLIDCLTEFVKEEVLEEDEKWSCPRCKRRTKSSKKFDIWKVPPILIICLKRFKYNKNSGSKLTKRVSFPFNGLKLDQVLSSLQKDNPEYDLFARIDHNGTLTDGHYYSIVKNIKNQVWYQFSDEMVNRCKVSNDICTNRNAYVLFYNRSTADQYYRQALSRPQHWPHILEEDIGLQDKLDADINTTIRSNTSLNSILSSENQKLDDIITVAPKSGRSSRSVQSRISVQGQTTVDSALKKIDESEMSK